MRNMSRRAPAVKKRESPARRNLLAIVMLKALEARSPEVAGYHLLVQRKIAEQTTVV